MNELLQANWWLLVVALLVGLVIAWWIFVGSRRTTVERDETGDVLDEGGRRAQRNQALIDAPPVAGPAAGGPGALPSAAVAGAGTMVAAAIAEQNRQADHDTDPAEIDDGTDTTTNGASPTAPAPVANGSPEGSGDDLTRIKGVGPKLADRLGELGINSWAQIAAWDDAEQARIDAELGRFAGRPERDDWRTQAQLLASGNETGFAERFGHG